MEEIKISVVIPFYNARDYVTQAVESALAQPETGEVLLVEDGSPDGGLEVCQALAKKYLKVRLLQHCDGKNHGGSASRNLGITNSRFPYIAFLDADDFFLPNRFNRTVEVFQNTPDVDGVYEAIGAVFQNEAVKGYWSNLPFKDVTTVTKMIEPQNLFEELIGGKSGYFSVDGFTVRKSLLQAVGYFNSELHFMEDTDCILKLSAKGRLYPGSIKEPVAMRRVHEKNRVTHHYLRKREFHRSNLLIWESFVEWGRNNLSSKREMLALFHLLDRIRMPDYFDDFRWKDFFEARIRMITLAVKFPKLLLKKLYWRMLLPSSKCFGKHEK